MTLTIARRSLIRMTAVFLALLFAASASARAEEDAPPAAATVAIESFHGKLLEVMKKADELDVRKRYERLEPAVTGSFALPIMIKIASGSYWPNGNEEKRSELVEAFEQMSVATYADRFDGWSGEYFRTLEQKPGPRGTVLVRTELVRPKDDPVELTYVMREIDGSWQAIDVLLAGGVSELARYRSEYRKILKDDSLEGLIRELRGKTETMLGPNSTGETASPPGFPADS